MTKEEELAQLDEGLLKAKQQLFRLHVEQKELLESNQLALFQPHKKQHEFFEDSLKSRRGVFTGNRFGKSTVGVVEDCCWLLGYRPFYEEGDPLRYAGIPEHGVKGLVIAEDWDKVKEIFTDPGKHSDRKGKFFDFLPESCIASTHRNQVGVIDAIYVESIVRGQTRKSVVYFDTVKSFKNNGAGQESSDWDFIHGDEPFPNDMWIAVSRGLIDRGGKAWFLMTPIKEPWIYHWFMDNALKDPENFGVITGDMDDNPLLEEKEKELFLSQLSEEERDCRKKGIPLALGHLVYPTFDENVHLFRGTPFGWKDPYSPPQEYLSAYAIDPHPQTPMAVLFVAISPIMQDGTRHVFWYDEIYEKIKLSELATMIEDRKLRARICYELCDPCAWIEDPETGRSWSDTLWDNGLRVEKATKAKTAGIMETRDHFRHPKMKVHVMEHMKRFRHEIRHYHFDKENKPVDKDDHMMECMYRLVMHDSLHYHSPYNSEQLPGLTNSDLNVSLSDELNSVSLTMVL